jgi:uncharacterized membrane protein YedE/YeeE
MNRQSLIAMSSGVLFALGLTISGMTDPERVLAFLDLAGDWDPALAFVMAGAVLVHMPFALRSKRKDAKPRYAAHYDLPPERAVDARLLTGAALFGVGWGIAGFCPGPALVALAGRGNVAVCADVRGSHERQDPRQVTRSAW